MMIGKGLLKPINGVLLLLLALGATASAAADKISYPARMAPNFPKAAEYKTIAVLPFKGDDGGAFTSALVGALQSAVFDNQPYFNVKTLESQNYVAPTGKTPAQNAEISAARLAGQKLGVDVVYIGEVVSSQAQKGTYTETRTVCVDKGNLIIGCKQTGQVPVACSKTSVTYAVIPRAINVKTGEVVYSNKSSTQDYYDQCGGEVKSKDPMGDLGKLLSFKKLDAPAVSTDEGLMDAVRFQVAMQVRQDVAPYNKDVQVEFKNDAPELPKTDRAKFKSAYSLARGGVLDRACGEWMSMEGDLSAKSLSLLYNIGTCQEILAPDDPASALEYYEKGVNLMTGSSVYKPLVEARTRARAMVDRKKALGGK